MRKLALTGLLLLAAACDPDYVVHHVGWFATMRHQRSFKPYAMPRAAVPGTVPTTGVWPDSLPVALADKLVNPRTRTSESLIRGQFEYQTYCQVCHGPAGKGDGPVSMAGGGPFPGVRPLVGPVADKLTDGYIYGVIVNATAMGRGLMPRYADKVRGTDRWDIVNYVRSLQQQERDGGKP
ncbi:MAG TPA: cytochrome c [Gemmatimonadales bacterium]|nr:cytochrome c [Gemmatimonadales bacterium]